MQVSVILLPGGLEEENQVPHFDPDDPVLRQLRSRGLLSRVTESPFSVPELAWIGLDPAGWSCAEGPLILAALGADPPASSVQFRLSLLSTEGDRVLPPKHLPDGASLEDLAAQAKRLDSARLEFVAGRGLDHGLVWEHGSIDLACVGPEQAFREGLSRSLPEGDGETMLRRYVDDSINLLSDLECNRIRAEEGLEPLNLLWPWSPGFRPSLPNVAVSRGAPAWVATPSLRACGLARLAGYRALDPWSLGEGTNLRLKALAEVLARERRAIAAIPTVGDFRRSRQDPEARWMGREILRRLIEPLLEAERADPFRILLVATRDAGDGLCLDYRSNSPAEDRPGHFAAETLDRRSLPVAPLHVVVQEALTPA